jgi:hypothetical protein
VPLLRSHLCGTASHERLGDHEPDDQPKLRRPRHHAVAGQDHIAHALGGGCPCHLDSTLDPHSCEQKGRNEKRGTTDRKDASHVRNRDEHACEQWPDESPKALDRRAPVALRGNGMAGNGSRETTRKAKQAFKVAGGLPLMPINPDPEVLQPRLEDSIFALKAT